LDFSRFAIITVIVNRVYEESKIYPASITGSATEQSRIKLLEAHFRNNLVGPQNLINDEIFLILRPFTLWPPFLHCKNV